MQYFQYLDCGFLQDIQLSARLMTSKLKNHLTIEHANHCFFQEFDQTITDKINGIFTDLGLGELHPILWFVRHRDYEMSPNKVHIDGNHTRPWASIVIPVSGCENTFQYWYDGDFVRAGSTLAAISGGKVQWTGVPRLAAIADTSHKCLLGRVNIPHGAVSNHNDIRITCTLRFKQNWTFEALLEKLSTQ